MRSSDWSSDVCSSDLIEQFRHAPIGGYFGWCPGVGKKEGRIATAIGGIHRRHRRDLQPAPLQIFPDLHMIPVDSIAPSENAVFGNYFTGVDRWPFDPRLKRGIRLFRHRLRQIARESCRE